MGKYVDANLENISNLSFFLENKSLEFKELTSLMKNTIGDISNSWDGEDAEEFIENINYYLDDLKRIEVELNTFSNIVNNYVSKYNDKISKYYDIVGRG